MAIAELALIVVAFGAMAIVFGARPHWGKQFAADAKTIAERYERLDDFRALAARLDPRGAFRNAWLERHVLGDG